MWNEAIRSVTLRKIPTWKWDVLILDLYTGIFGMEMKAISNGGLLIRHGAYVGYFHRSRSNEEISFSKSIIRLYETSYYMRWLQKAGLIILGIFTTRFETI